MSRQVALAAAATFVVAVVIFVVQELIDDSTVPMQQLSVDTHGHTWGYTPEDGPNMWPLMFHGCEGREQSPINIVTKSVLKNPGGNASALTLRWTAMKGRHIINTGHGIQVSRMPPSLEHNPLLSPCQGMSHAH
jgi:carbonic anhydrase